MTTSLAIRTGEQLGWSQADIGLIKDTVAIGATDQELAMFLQVATRSGLNPFTRQIHFVKRWNAALRREVGAIQTGIDGYRLIADRTERYAPGKEPAFHYDDDGALVSATAYVKKLVGGVWHNVAATAMWDEYRQTKKDGSLTPMWERMPHTMLAKCAEALALRRAFPAELSGLYTHEEMAQADNPEVIEAPAVRVEQPAALPAKANGHDGEPTPTPKWHEGFMAEALALEVDGATYYRHAEHVKNTLKQAGYTSMKRSEYNAMMDMLWNHAEERTKERAALDAEAGSEAESPF